MISNVSYQVTTAFQKFNSEVPHRRHEGAEELVKLIKAGAAEEIAVRTATIARAGKLISYDGVGAQNDGLDVLVALTEEGQECEVAREDGILCRAGALGRNDRRAKNLYMSLAAD